MKNQISLLKEQKTKTKQFNGYHYYRRQKTMG